MQVPMSPVRILKRAVKLYAEKTAVVDGDMRFSYEEVQNRVNRVVHAVHEMGISPGGRIAVLDHNTYRYMELYFGMAASGCVLSPLNTRLTAEEYTYILKDAEAEAIIHTQSLSAEDKSRYSILNKENLDYLMNRYNRVNRWVIADMIRRRNLS